MPDEYVLQLSTAAAPTRKMKVDGEDYEILTDAHLSPAEEAQVVALFARHGVISSELDMTKNTAVGEKLAAQLRSTQVAIFTKLTTMPREVAEKLHATQQAQLFRVLAATQEADDEGEDVADAEEPGGGGGDEA